MHTLHVTDDELRQLLRALAGYLAEWVGAMPASEHEMTEQLLDRFSALNDTV